MSRTCAKEGKSLAELKSDIRTAHQKTVFFSSSCNTVECIASSSYINIYKYKYTYVGTQ